MSHLDEDLIADLALGEPSDEAHRLHVQSCPDCAQRLSDLEVTLAAVSSLRNDAILARPPEHVWSSIQAELAADNATNGADELAQRRQRIRRVGVPWGIVSAAAAGAVIGGIAVGAMMSDSPVQVPPVIAQADLIDLGSEAVVGVATVHTLPDGYSLLVLDVPVQQLDDAALEVWLIDTAVEGMISLGHLTPDNTTFVIPAGFDVSEFPIVDVSVEPFDGDPTHSGDSITRGLLET